MSDTNHVPTSAREVIALWPSLSDFAADIGCGYGAAKQMRRRNSISLRRHAAVVAAAEVRGFAVVTAQLLAELAARRARNSQSSAEQMIGALT